MGEYSWDVRQIWFGVEGPEPDRKMLGIIKRSGRVKQLGHFCHVKISVNGKKVWASGAESRTFYIHLVEWNDIGGYVPKDMIPALGWTNDGNTYCVLHEGEVMGYGSGGSLHPIHPDKWGSPWKEDLKTLIERGAAITTPGPYNAYVALMEEPTRKGDYRPQSPRPRVTLPLGCFHTEAQEFRGLVGALSIWNGKPPPWCKQVVQVYQTGDFGGWVHVKDDELMVLWDRQEKTDGS